MPKRTKNAGIRHTHVAYNIRHKPSGKVKWVKVGLAWEQPDGIGLDLKFLRKPRKGLLVIRAATDKH